MPINVVQMPLRRIRISLDDQDFAYNGLRSDDNILSGCGTGATGGHQKAAGLVKSGGFP